MNGNEPADKQGLYKCRVCLGSGLNLKYILAENQHLREVVRQQTESLKSVAFYVAMESKDDAKPVNDAIKAGEEILK